METSNSIKSAQSIKLCEICKEERIKWKCTECDTIICDKCKSVHLEGDADHKMVTITTPYHDVQLKATLESILCTDHKTKKVCLFCRTCDSLVCPDCVTTTHINHDFVPMETTFDEKLSQLKRTRLKIINNLKFYQAKSQEIQKNKLKYNFIFDESVRKIRQKEEQLKNGISEHSNALQERVEDERAKMEIVATKTEQQLQQVIKNLEEQKQKADSILTSKQGKVLFDPKMRISDVLLCSYSHEDEHLCPDTKSKQMDDLLGSFKDIAIPTITQDIRFKLIKTFTSDCQLIHQVCSIDETSAWVTSISEKSVKKVTIQGNSLTTLKEISFQGVDIALTTVNDVLLTGPSGVHKVGMSGELKPFLTVAPLELSGIHVTKDDDVMVGIKEPGNLYTPTDESQRALMIFCTDGNLKKLYQYDKDKKKMFTFLARITSNANKDIIVIDRTSHFSGRVVTLDENGEFQWIYTGNTETTDGQFDPCGVATTSEGHILVCDARSHAVHVLSIEGNLLLCKDMNDIGIKYPYSLNIDRGGRLWVGCAPNEKGAKAKLHIVQMIC